MRMSRLVTRTLRDDPPEAETASHRLMLRAGLIQQVASGVYAYLPLAWRSLRKIEQIVREEMDAAGSQELLMPAGQAGGAALPQEPCRRDPRAVQRPRFWGGSTAQKRKP
jgi:prolyl-tRNA synthetase